MSTPVGSTISASASTASAAVKNVGVDGKSAAHTWEDTNSGVLWENAVQEDSDGNIIVDRNETLHEVIRQRRKRLEQNDYSQRHRRIVRAMIRYLYIIIDGSRWVRQKDPMLTTTGGSNRTRLEVIIHSCLDFIKDFYDQNPLSHLGFILCKNGEAEIITQLSGNSRIHKLALHSILTQMNTTSSSMNNDNGNGGEFSLQNGLEVAGRSLGHQPRYGSREIVILTAALSTCDPGYILTETIPKLLNAKIRVSCFTLSAELHICYKLASLTSGTAGVCLDYNHFRDWLYGQTVPPPSNTHASTDGTDNIIVNGCEMILMGFPTRTTSTDGIAVLVHATREKTLLAHTAYTCPQCQAKNYELPTDCAVCGLKLVLAPHLARSFHHLFPVQPFIDQSTASIMNLSDANTTNKAVVATPIKSIASSSSVDAIINNQPTPLKAISSSSSKRKNTTKKNDNDNNKQLTKILNLIDNKIIVTSKDDDTCCYSCLQPLKVIALEAAMASNAVTNNIKSNDTYNNNSNEMLRFQCPECFNYFCVDCDAFLHESLHNCPGCLCI